MITTCTCTYMYVQWNLYNTDTIGTPYNCPEKRGVLNSEVEKAWASISHFIFGTVGGRPYYGGGLNSEGCNREVPLYVCKYIETYTHVPQTKVYELTYKIKLLQDIQLYKGTLQVDISLVPRIIPRVAPSKKQDLATFLSISIQHRHHGNWPGVQSYSYSNAYHTHFSGELVDFTLSVANGLVEFSHSFLILLTLLVRLFTISCTSYKAKSMLRLMMVNHSLQLL